MKKLLSNLFTRFILPGICCGIFSYIISYFLIKPEGRNLPSTKRILILISIIMALIFGMYYSLMTWIQRKTKKVYEQIDVYMANIEHSFDIIELEHYIELLKQYKNSKECFSVQHMRYAN